MNIENSKQVLDLIYKTVISEGGDGDAIWLSKHTSLYEISNLINQYNINNNTGWVIEENEKYIHWGINQEWVIITCDENFFKTQPDCIILHIIY